MIAIIYTETLSIFPLGGAFLCILALFALNKRKISELSPYMVVGTLLWVCVLKSGLHATLAGVIVAIFTPQKSNNVTEPAPLYRLEHGLHLWVAFLILPVFALANAGVSLKGLSTEFFTEPLTLGVGVGLLFGKQIGVMLFTYIGVVFKLCSLPTGIRWSQYYGLALLAGIGFTMSLFIGELAFDDDKLQTLVRLGVITGSLASGMLGYFTLRITSPKQAVR
jgi:NhaA family Na+:H+ antiporter